MGRRRSDGLTQRSSQARRGAPAAARFERRYRPRLELLEDRVQPGDTILGLSAVALWGLGSDVPLGSVLQDRRWHDALFSGLDASSSLPALAIRDFSRTEKARSETNLTAIAPPSESAVALTTPMSPSDDALTGQVAINRLAGLTVLPFQTLAVGFGPGGNASGAALLAVGVPNASLAPTAIGNLAGLSQQLSVAAPTLSFNVSTGQLAIQTDAGSHTVRDSVTPDGFMDVTLDGRRHSSNPGSASFDSALTGASSSTVTGVSFAGGSQDTLVLGSQHLAGNLTVQAPNITVSGAVQASTISLAASDWVTVDAASRIDAGRAGVLTSVNPLMGIDVSAGVFVNSGQLHADGATGGQINIDAGNILGVLSGTPTSTGTSPFTITATDSKIGGLTGNQAYTLTVNAAGNTPPVTSATITTPYLTIPNFGANPTIYSVGSGNWSNPATWSLGRVPGAGDIVDINPGTTVTYDVNATVQLNTLEIQPTATLTFRTDINTQVIVGNFLVLQGGSLVVGTAANPIAANVAANINLGNLPFNSANDPQQFGDGLIVLGNVTMHGAVKTPYATLAQEVHAGDTVLHFATPVTGWQAGDDPVLPDTRQLSQGNNNGTNYQPQWERVIVQSVSADGLTVNLTAPVKYAHLGARDAKGVLNYLPQAMNDSRNIMLQSQNFTGMRGYTLFTNRANVDIEYAGFCELGRTTNNPASASNVADRYAMTMLDLIGPSTPQANGYQFTLLGDEVDNDGDGNPSNPSNIQWGIAVNNSFYGLIQYNTVFAVAGVGIGVEDAASSYNLFDHNFVANVTGTAGKFDAIFAGDAFWFHNPNNYVTNNIAADINGGGHDVFSYGFDIDASVIGNTGGIGTQSVAAYQGADPSVAGQSKQVNMNDTPILAFSGNEVYGATPSGMTLWLIGTNGDNFYSDAQVSVVNNFTVWNVFNRGVYGYPTNNLVINHLVVRGDASQLNNQANYSTGVVFDDYMTRNLVIENADIQGMATGINVPYMVGRVAQMNTTTIQNSYLDNTANIDISPPRSVNGSGGLSPNTIDIINVTFGQPTQADPTWKFNIAMDYNTGDAFGNSNMSIPQYVYVTNYNGIQGDNFQVFYTQSNSPTGTPPSGAKSMALIQGLVLAD